MSGDTGERPESEVMTIMTPDHTSFQVGLSRNWSVYREGFGSLSLQPVDCTPWCSTDDLSLVARCHKILATPSVSHCTRTRVKCETFPITGESPQSPSLAM